MDQLGSLVALDPKVVKDSGVISDLQEHRVYKAIREPADQPGLRVKQGQLDQLGNKVCAAGLALKGRMARSDPRDLKELEVLKEQSAHRVTKGHKDRSVRKVRLDLPDCVVRAAHLEQQVALAPPDRADHRVILALSDQSERKARSDQQAELDHKV